MCGGNRLEHQLRQPLNIALLSCANLRARILPRLPVSDATYFESKVFRIEQQIARMTQILDSMDEDNPAEV